MSNEEFNEQFRNRTKAFAKDIIRYCDQLPASLTARVIIFQLCKAATSVGANFRAFCRGRSRNERYSKICIVVEEADESVYWLELIAETGKDQTAELHRLIGEGTEILKIVVTIKTRLSPDKQG
jgi:four helix bundle protein